MNRKWRKWICLERRNIQNSHSFDCINYREMPGFGGHLIEACCGYWTNSQKSGNESEWSVCPSTSISGCFRSKRFYAGHQPNIIQFVNIRVQLQRRDWMECINFFTILLKVESLNGLSGRSFWKMYESGRHLIDMSASKRFRVNCSVDVRR
jgi:hypothetical protein